MSKGYNPDDEMSDAWRKDPNNWIWGIFYFNKRDKRIFPPKRIPAMGWTINFANPYSILVTVTLITAVVVISAFAK